jgi:hypothetical protein
LSLADIIIRILRKFYRIFAGKSFLPPSSIIDRDQANENIYLLLNSSSPTMISRFGTTELISINNYLCITSQVNFVRKIFNYITDHTHTPWWFKAHFKFLDEFSGVYPPTAETSKRFAERYLNDIPFIDILGSFQYYERFMPLNENVIQLQLETLYPFFVEHPWTSVLKGKKVLVVHPFEDTIRHQYKRRELLFEHPEILPEFELITIKAVQSAAGVRPPFKDWFEALNFMENQISNTEFDICLLGCGAYGMPLAAHVKRMGKKAVHLGGGLQLLFGIKGKRWDNPNYGIVEYKEYPGLMQKPYSSLYNQYWIRPLESDTPPTAEKLEGAAYW